jgi:uncharacterized protein (TIGR02996 family)
MPRKKALTQQEAFLQAIVEDPRDDVTRLVYADWLEENGQPERAQFIRAQVALATAAPDDPRRKALEREERKLLRGRKATWKAELPKLKGVNWGEFDRGFVGSVTFVSAYRYHQHAARVTRAAPIEVITFRPRRWGDRISTTGLANSPHLAKVRVLCLAQQNLNDESIETLMASKHLGSLEVLDLSHNQIGDPGAGQLAEAAGLPRLDTLDLAHNQIGPEGARALAESESLRGLTFLDLTGNPIGQGRALLQRRFGGRFVFTPAEGRA